MGGSSDYCYEIFVKSLRMNEISERETLEESRGCDNNNRPPPINSRLLLLSRAPRGDGKVGKCAIARDKGEESSPTRGRTKAGESAECEGMNL